MKPISFFTVLILIILLIGCSGDQSKKSSADKIESSNQKSLSSTTLSDKGKSKQASELPAAQIEKAKQIIASVDQVNISDMDPTKIFKMYCATCHGFKGDMMVNGAKDLTKASGSLENSVAQVYHGKGLMTPYKDILTSEEIIAVCQYIETLRK